VPAVHHQHLRHGVTLQDALDHLVHQVQKPRRRRRDLADPVEIELVAVTAGWRSAKHRAARQRRATSAVQIVAARGPGVSGASRSRAQAAVRGDHQRRAAPTQRSCTTRSRDRHTPALPRLRHVHHREDGFSHGAPGVSLSPFRSVHRPRCPR
jgi:hypothetical protein